MRNRRLHKQLRTEGASPSDARLLSELAKSVADSSPRNMTNATKDRIAREIGIKPTLPLQKFVFAGVGSLSVLIVFTLSSSALPGSTLYPVKRSSERVREIIQPSYAEEIIETRKQEVEQLQAQPVEESRIKEAEKEYHKAVKKHRERTRKSQDKHESNRQRQPDRRNRRDGSESRERNSESPRRRR